MQGTIKTYLPEKRYGFIKGNDGKDYFFHENNFIDKSHIRSLAEDVLIEFEQVATPKGYQAKQCKVLSTIEEMKYIQPDTFITTKQSYIKGWEIIEAGEWVVLSSSADSPDAAKDIVIQKAKRIGANALVDLRYNKSTGSEGNYEFSIHHFQGRITVIGKKSAKGTQVREELLGINKQAELLYGKIQEKRKYDTKIMQDEERTALLVFGIILLFSIIAGVIAGAIVCLATVVIAFFVAGALIPKRKEPREIWLKRSF